MFASRLKRLSMLLMCAAAVTFAVAIFGPRWLNETGRDILDLVFPVVYVGAVCLVLLAIGMDQNERSMHVLYALLVQKVPLEGGLRLSIGVEDGLITRYRGDSFQIELSTFDDFSKTIYIVGNGSIHAHQTSPVGVLVEQGSSGSGRPSMLSDSTPLSPNYRAEMKKFIKALEQVSSP